MIHIIWNSEKLVKDMVDWKYVCKLYFVPWSKIQLCKLILMDDFISKKDRNWFPIGSQGEGKKD